MNYTKKLDKFSVYALKTSMVEIVPPEQIETITYGELFDLFAASFQVEVFIEYNFYLDLYYSRVVVKKDSDKDNWTSRFSERYEESWLAFRDAVIMAIDDINKI